MTRPAKQSAERRAENAVRWLEEFAGPCAPEKQERYAEQRRALVAFIVELEHRAASAEVAVASLTAAIERAREVLAHPEGPQHG